MKRAGSEPLELSQLLDILREGFAPVGSSKGVRATQRLKRRFSKERVETFRPQANAVRFVTIAFVRNEEKAQQLLAIIERRRLKGRAVLNLLTQKAREAAWAASFGLEPSGKKRKPT